MNNIEELKKAALGANLHGWTGFEDALNADGYSEAVSKFIGHCYPSEILTLIAQLEAAHGSIKELESKVNHYVAAEYAHKHFDQTAEIIKRADSAELELVKVKAELSAANERTLAPVILEIANERLRQISVEGWTPEHDDQHSSGELAGAAGCYAKHVNARQWCFKNNPDDYQCEPEPSGWPWAAEWWKPKNPRSDLIRAAALIVAELERLDRAAGFTVEE
ncbi:hypothetical protein OZ806_003146 [Yersinia enterocolitica]